MELLLNKKEKSPHDEIIQAHINQLVPHFKVCQQNPWATKLNHIGNVMHSAFLQKTFTCVTGITTLAIVIYHLV